MLWCFLRNSGRKTGSHFCWNCFVFFSAIPDAKPVPTFAGIALASHQPPPPIEFSEFCSCSWIWSIEKLAGRWAGG